MLHRMRQNFWDVKLCTASQSMDFLRNFCPTTLQPANWTLKIDVTVLHFDGTIANHREIGLGHLLPSWFQDVFTLQVQVEERQPLMELNQGLRPETL